MFTDTDFELVMIRHQERIAEGLHDQFLASVLPPPPGPAAVLAALRQQLGTRLVDLGARLQGMQAATRENVGAVVKDERGVLA